MIVCCGVNCRGSFCPNCGKRLTIPHPLGLLLSHCQEMAQRAQARVNNLKEWTEEDQDDSERTKRFKSQALKAEKSCNKWKNWAEELEKILTEGKDNA